MMGFWDAVASAGPYANNLHLTDKHTNTSSLNFFTDRILFLMTDQPCQSTEGIKQYKKWESKIAIYSVHVHCSILGLSNTH